MTSTRRVLRVVGVPTFALALLAAQGPPTPAALISGTWHGTSSCLDRIVDRACRDEEVVYKVDSAAGPRGPVSIRADKVVNGVPQPMGVFRLNYDSTSASWFVEFSTSRFRGRWTYEVHDSVMVGRLSELPSQRLVRRVAVRRASAR
jgi:hypothetical protein